MLKYDKKLAAEGYFVDKYEDRFFWDTPENLEIYSYGTKGGWSKFEHNPVLGGKYGTCFDLSVLEDEDKYKMWFSWRPHECIAYSESKDGYNWSEPIEVLRPNPESNWDRDELNRPSVVKVDNIYKMWYSGQMEPYTNEGKSSIGFASSEDGVHWKRFNQPVMIADQLWEGKSIMCPHVIYDKEESIYRMWYSGGGNHEPDAIGYAQSKDGIQWEKYSENPIMAKDIENPWERDKVAACHVLKWDGYYYMFYIGFIHVDRAAIGLARSISGIADWEKYPLNPIISPDKGGFDEKAVYKPYIIRKDNKWIMWYNGAKYIPNSEEIVIEQIGVAILEADNLWNL